MLLIVWRIASTTSGGASFEKDSMIWRGSHVSTYVSKALGREGKSPPLDAARGILVGKGGPGVVCGGRGVARRVEEGSRGREVGTWGRGRTGGRGDVGKREK